VANRGRLSMVSVRLATTRAAGVDVDVEAMVTLMREAGTGRFGHSIAPAPGGRLSSAFINAVLLFVVVSP
jgi:hypothetical protein